MESSGGTAAVEGEEASTTSFQNIPCLVCGSNCFIKSESEESEGTRNTTTTTLDGSQCQLLKIFCQLMKSKNGSKVVWEDSEGEGLPICGDCGGRLTLLVELERKVRELGLAYQDGVRDFRRLCEGAEGMFEGSGIYERDRRYYKFRRQIVRVGIGRPKRGAGKLQREKVSTRRSSRSVRTEGPSSLTSLSPVVSVSADDRAKAEEFQQVLKTEPVPSDDDNGNGNGGWDDFHLGSPEPGPGPARLDGDDSGMNDNVGVLVEGDNLAPDLDEVRGQRTKRQRKSKKPKPHPEEPKRKRGRKPNPPTAAGVPRITLKAKGKRKVQTIKDCDLEESDFEEEMMKRKLWNDKMAEDDSDFEVDDKTEPEAASPVPEDDEGVDDGFDAEDDLSESSNGKLQPDPVTGLYSFLKVKFRPMQDNPDNLECLECHTTIKKSVIRKHTSHSSVFKCPTCGQCFSTRGNLEHHILRKHKRAKKKRKRPRIMQDCPICGRPSSKNVLKLHMATHYSEQDKAEALARGEVVRTWSDRDPKRHQCDLCGKRYAEKFYLERHMLSKHPQPEDAEKLLANKELCPECGVMVEKTYMSTHRLRTHSIGEDGRLLTPEAARPFICSYCDKRFFTNSLLLRHRRVVHEKIYPFQCTLCPRTFAKQRGLDIHINGHRNIRPYACTNCPVAFFTQGNLKRHQELYHVEGGQAKAKRTAYMRGSTAGIPKHPRYGKRKNIQPRPLPTTAHLQE